MDPVTDIKRTVKKFGEGASVYRAIDDLDDLNYDKTWINEPTAFGDTHRYDVYYTIGDYHFKYKHLCCCNSRDIFSPSFKVFRESEDKNEGEDFHPDSSLVKEFIEHYNTKLENGGDDKLSFNDYAYGLFAFLNAFTLGHSMIPYIDDEINTVIYAYYVLHDLPYIGDEDEDDDISSSVTLNEIISILGNKSIDVL